MLKLPKGWNVWVVVVVALMIIGIMASLKNILLPIIILGGIFLLYKFPPSLWFKGRESSRRTQVVQNRANATKAKSNRPRSKTVPFRVIEGGKDDNDMPKYH